MNKMWKITKGMLIMLYMIFLLHIMLNNTSISVIYSFPVWFLPVISFTSVFIIGCHLMKLSFRNDRIESEFTSIVNHTFRTPLTRISWFAKELEKDLPREEKISYLQNMVNSTERILGIVDVLAGIQNINDRSGYMFQAVSVREMVEKSLAKYRDVIKQKNINLQVSAFEKVPLLTVDIKKLSFVIDVLVENAVYYTPNGGNVSVGYEMDRRNIKIFVRDSGVGLGMYEKMKIFSRFYRTKTAKLMNTDGMGLGLYLAKSIIARHNGRIYAKSAGANKGSTFFIELPLK